MSDMNRAITMTKKTFDISFTHNEPRGKLLMALEQGGITWTRHKPAKVTWYNSYKTRDYFVAGAINSGCYDVSKSRVDQIQAMITGYPLNINPATYKGKYIEKSETQDGKSKISPYVVCKKPQEAHPGYVYQKMLGNGLSEYRYLWCRGIVAIITKRKETINGHATSYGISFQSKHDQRVEMFCNQFGMDYGEVDVINGVIIDANNIPGSTVFNIMSKDDKFLILNKLAKSIKEKILI